MTGPSVPLPTFLAPPGRPYTSALLDELDVSSEWVLLEDVLADVICAWRDVEDGQLSSVNRSLGALVGSLRARRDAIEAAARE